MTIHLSKIKPNHSFVVADSQREKSEVEHKEVDMSEGRKVDLTLVGFEAVNQVDH